MSLLKKEVRYKKCKKNQGKIFVLPFQTKSCVSCYPAFCHLVLLNFFVAGVGVALLPLHRYSLTQHYGLSESSIIYGIRK